jgi:hypothetical protein
MDFANKKVLVWDAVGLGVEHAVRLGRDFKKCYYYTPWETAMFEAFAHGKGMENIEKVLYFFDYVDDVDLIYFVDTGFGDCAAYLRDKGYPVFGAGMGERLESNRFEARKLQKELGLPTQRTVRVKGVTQLREYIQAHAPVFVKFDIFRGTLESFFAKDYMAVEVLIDEIESGFGPFKEEYEFICEEPINDAIEVGTDGFFNGTKFLDTSMWGIEAGVAYIGTYQSIPKLLKNTLNKFTPELQRCNYRGAFSTEERIVSPKKGYLVDITARYPYSLSQIYTESIENYSEVIYKVARGEDVTLVPKAQYVAAAPIYSTHADKNWLRLLFDKSLRADIKLQQCCKVGDYYYCVKGNKNGALLIAMGDNVEGCVSHVEELADKIDAHELEKDGIRPLRKIMGMFEDLKKIAGIDFGGM